MFGRATINGAFSFFNKKGVMAKPPKDAKGMIPKMKPISLSDRERFYHFMKSCGIEKFKFFDRVSRYQFATFCEQNPQPWNPLLKTWRAKRMGHLVPPNARINSRADLERFRTPRRAPKASATDIAYEMALTEFFERGD